MVTTWSNHRKRRRYNGRDTVCYQIDLILVKELSKDQVRDYEGYPAGDKGSDQNLVMMKCGLGLKKLQ